MSRPGLIIGLGGTGQWVLTFLKKELLEINNQQMPANVRLLAFDTLPQATAETEQAGGDKEVKIGKVKLETGIEFVHLGGNVFPIVEGIATDGDHPHIGSWFQAKYFLQALPRAAFNLSAGAGAIRPLGRMGIFNDMAAPSTSQLWSKIMKAVREVKNQVNGERQLEIIIISSLAGGTGSGMFLDIANIVRNAASEVLAANFIVRGMFVLPRAFRTNDRAMQARAFAAWRELDRFMINDPDLGRKTIEYNDADSTFHMESGARLFDVCYLLDPARDANPLTSYPPDQGIFPCLADIISAILDSTAGEKYTEWVTTNLAPGYAKAAGKPLHSSIGAYTIQVPMYHMVQEAAHDLALQFLDELLQPDVQGGRIVRLAPNRNPNAPSGRGTSGSDEALRFLAQSTIARQGSGAVNPTLLPAKVYEILTQDVNRNPATLGPLVIEHAESGTSAGKGRASLPWLVPFTSLGGDPQSKQIEQEISDAVNAELLKKVPGAKVLPGERPAQTFTRVVPDVESFKKEYIGTQNEKGEFIGGKYSAALATARTEHLRRFRESLRLELLNILLPPNQEGQPANVGALGYAVDFADGMVRYLNNFIEFMDTVAEERSKRHPQNKLFEKTRRKQGVAQGAVGKRWIFGLFIAPEAYNNINDYLSAEQQLINVQKAQLLHDAVYDTSVDMRDYVRKISAELAGWVVQLATGDNASDIRSLHDILAESREYVISSRAADDRVQSVRRNEGTIVGAVPAADRQRYLDDMLRRVTWDVTADANNFALHFGIAPVRDTAGAELSPGQTFTNSPTRARKTNLDALRTVTERYLTTYQRENGIAHVLAQSVDYDGRQIAELLANNAEPLYKAMGSGPGETSCIIRVHSRIGDSETEAAFATAEHRIQELRSALTMVRMVDSDDPYKCTIVRSDDLIESRNFTAWRECREEYIKAITDERAPIDPRILHILPAEVNASYYESRLPNDLGLRHRTFEPKVVMLMEDMGKVRTFFLAYILGLIQEREEDNRVWYEVMLPDGPEPLWLTAPATNRSDIFALMNSFVNKGRDARPRKSARVNYGKVDKAVDQAIAGLGDLSARIQRLTNEAAEDKGSLLMTLLDTAGEQYEGNQVTRNGGREYAKQEYADLADLLRLILHEEITRLKQRRG